MNIGYLTGNRKKFEEARLILKDEELEPLTLPLPEIQGEAEEVILAKAHYAADRVARPFIVEDVAMVCPALGGLPGPYIKDFLRKLGDEGLYRLLFRLGDCRATVTCFAAYVRPGHEPILFEGNLEGSLVPPRGDLHHGTLSWNSIFLPKGSQKTMGEMTLQEHAEMSMRGIALSKLGGYLKENAGR